MPWRYGMLYAAAVAGTFWGSKLFTAEGSVPKSCLSGRKLRISNSSTESQKKEKVSPPGWYRMNFMYLYATAFRTCFHSMKGIALFCHRQMDENLFFLTVKKNWNFLVLCLVKMIRICCLPHKKL